jgi:hypothetical protein
MALVALGGAPPLVLLVASDLFFTGDVMVVGHLARPARSTTSRHVGLFGMLLLVPLQQGFLPFLTARYTAVTAATARVR